jgi:carbamate kinase
VVVAAGGGGIPVVADGQGMLSGVPAVIDKDLASAVLANQIDADLLVISTEVPSVCINYGKRTQQELECITLAQAKQFAAAGHFGAGSMLPKVEACVNFIHGGGHEAVITCPSNLSQALAGIGGTRIVP